MKFTIISLNDDRALYKKLIRDRVKYEEIQMPAVDGRVVDISKELERRSLFVEGWGNAKRGEIGVWLSNYDRWKLASSLDEPLIVFEDDAIPYEDFDSRVGKVMAELPSEWDFLSLWVPDNQRNDYLYDIDFDENGVHIWNNRPWRSNDTSKYRVNNSDIISLAYQGYGMVSLMYSPAGASKLLRLAHETGLTGPVDCWLFEQAHRGAVDGYTLHPYQTKVVGYDNWNGISHAQHTEKAL